MGACASPGWENNILGGTCSARGGECLGAPNESSVLGVGLHGNGCGGAGGWLLPLAADRGELRRHTALLTLAKRSTAPALSSEYKMAGGLFIFALLATLNFVIRSRFHHSTPQSGNAIHLFLVLFSLITEASASDPMWSRQGLF